MRMVNNIKAKRIFCEAIKTDTKMSMLKANKR